MSPDWSYSKMPVLWYSNNSLWWNNLHLIDLLLKKKARLLIYLKYYEYFPLVFASFLSFESNLYIYFIFSNYYVVSNKKVKNEHNFKSNPLWRHSEKRLCKITIATNIGTQKESRQHMLEHNTTTWLLIRTINMYWAPSRVRNCSKLFYALTHFILTIALSMIILIL